VGCYPSVADDAGLARGVEVAMRRVTGWAVLLVLLGAPGRAGAAKEKFDRSKPHVAVTTLGDTAEGEATLAAAIVKVQGDAGLPTFPSSVSLSRARFEGPGGVGSICEARYETATRHYAHTDCPSAPGFVRGLISGTPAMDGAILVVSAADGPTPRAREHVLLARQVGAPSIVVYIDKVDLVPDPELLDLVELEVRELLSRYEFPGATTPVIRGSALRALQGDPGSTQSVRDLLDAMDRWIPLPPRDKEKPFLMPVEDVFSITGRGTVATGRVERGVVAPGDSVEAVGFGPGFLDRVVSIERPPGALEALPGDRVALALQTLPNALRRGMVLAHPGTIAPHRRFKAEVYVLTKEEGGRHTPFFNGYRPQFYFRTTDVTGDVTLPPGLDALRPGDHAEFRVDLDVPLALELRQRFEIRDPSRLVDVGVVTALDVP
jgi:elongation factor Tu